MALNGYVKDNFGNPIAGAILYYWGDFTYSDKNGYFALYSKFSGTAREIRISYPGYTNLNVENPKYHQTYTLTKINHNGWIKRWTINSTSEIPDWKNDTEAKFYSGDFDGNGRDEILWVQTGSKTRMKHWFFNTDISDWDSAWTNDLANEITSYRENLVVGDFDGDGKDELLGNLPNETGKMTLFNFDNGNWQAGWTDMGQDSLGTMRPYYKNLIPGKFMGNGRTQILGNEPGGRTTLFRFINNTWIQVWTDSLIISPLSIYKDKFIAGDFNGDGRTEILGNDLPNGAMALFRWNGSDWSTIWTDNGIDSMGIYPYRNQLVVGNFDSDAADEILGMNSEAAKFDFSATTWNKTWSTGNTGIFSDWSTRENLSSLTEYFFVKIHKYAPEQLFAKRIEMTGLQLQNNINMYALNESKECPIDPATRFPDNVSPHPPSDEFTIYVYPNPGFGVFDVSFELKEKQNTNLIVFDMLGRKILEKNQGLLDTGNHTVRVDIYTETAGIYFVKIMSGDEEAVAKVVVR